MASYSFKVELRKDKKPRPDESKLGFGKIFTDHMFIMNYSEGKGWHDGRIVPYDPIPIDPAAMVFHYGQAVFEGMKCYKTGDGKLNLFRPKKNFERLNASDARMCIPHIDEEQALAALIELIKIDKDWIPTAPDTSLYIRPFVIATQSALGVHPSHDFLFMIILSPVGPYYAEGLAPVGIYIEDEYVRAVRGGIGFTKSSANYAISMKGQEKAIAKGFAQVLWLDGINRKYIEEVGAMNIFLKINGEVLTPMLSGSILPGITRDSVIQLLKSWGVNVSERNISIDEIVAASENGTLEEAFGTGTAAVISPVGRFVYNDKEIKVGDGKNFELANKLYKRLTGIQYGREKDEFGWIMEVK